MGSLPPLVAQSGQNISVTVLHNKRTNIKFQIVNILVKFLGMLGDLDVRIPIDEGLVRYDVGKEE